MRIASRLLAGSAVLAMTVACSGLALADPPRGVTPRAGDVVGVGSDTTGYLLDQLALDYDKAHLKSGPLLYSWDPVNPATGQAGGRIVTKAACPAMARPDGSAAGVSALIANKTDPSDTTDYCIDFAGSSSVPTGGDPPCGSGGVCFIQLARDAVTWAARDAASGGSDAPSSLTMTQLKDIYLCKITNWAAVGGRRAPIRPYLPQAASGTRTSWLIALGGGTPLKPGSCVRDDGNALQDNQGVSKVLDNPEVIVPYSVADFLAQAYHDARCARASCSGSPPCHPSATQDRFGCDRNGVLGLHQIGGSEPALPWPLPRSACPKCAINPAFSRPFQRTVFLVVRYAPTPDHIPAYLEPFLAASTAKVPGWICSAPKARADIRDYGFEPLSGGAAAPAARVPGGPMALTQCGTPYLK